MMTDWNLQGICQWCRVAINQCMEDRLAKKPEEGTVWNAYGG